MINRLDGGEASRRGFLKVAAGAVMAMRMCGTRVMGSKSATAGGMTIGGPEVGYVRLTADGRLTDWDIFHHALDDGRRFEPDFVLSENGADRPICGDRHVMLDVFAPAGLPAVVLRYRVKSQARDAKIIGRMENAVACYSRESHSGWRVNRSARDANFTSLVCGVEAKPEDGQASVRPAIGVDGGAFEIERPFINGVRDGARLVVGGRVVRTDAVCESWSVRSLVGRRGRVEGQRPVELSDRPAHGTALLADAPDVGTMAIGVAGAAECEGASGNLGDRVIGSVTKTLDGGGDWREATFVLAWHFPNRPAALGGRPGYAARFADAGAVASYAAGVGAGRVVRV